MLPLILGLLSVGLLGLLVSLQQDTPAGHGEMQENQDQALSGPGMPRQPGPPGMETVLVKKDHKLLFSGKILHRVKL